MRWYITGTAVREYQKIMGLPVASGGPSFDCAASELDALCGTARFVKDEGHRAIYRALTYIEGKRVRLELTVSLSERDEGDLPQLVRVAHKGGLRRSKKGNR